MLNPIDKATTRAMIEYRQNELSRLQDRDRVIADDLTVQSVNNYGFAWSVRRSLGLRLMRAGARLAGVGMQVRVGAQS
jgi:hypothetical protein